MKAIFSFLAILMIGSFAPEVHAQSTRPERTVKVSTDTSTNADTVTVQFIGMASNVNAFQAVVKKVSGTVGGYVLLQGTIDGTNWVDVNTDTLTVTNQATNSRVWTMTCTNFYSYRAWYRSTAGTQTSTLSLSYMRRPDE